MQLSVTADHLNTLINQFLTLWLILSGLRILLIILGVGMMVHWIRKTHHHF